MNLETMIANALAGARMTIDDFTVSEPDKYGKVVVRSVDIDSRKLRNAYQVVCHSLPKGYGAEYSTSGTDPNFTVWRRLHSV